MSSGDDRDYNGIKINDYNAVKISLANPKTIRENSKGEVKKPETVNYRTFRPERDGLFCERIFGPERDWECSCGKYRGMKYKGMTCDRCGVKITRCNVRRSRMGHIELAAPVVHIWFFKAASSKLANLLDMKTSDLEKVIYFQDYVVIDPGEAPVKTGDVINESKYREFREEFRDSGFKAEMGAEAVRKLLNRLNLVEESRKLREEIKTVRSKQARKDYITRLRLIDALKNCRNENNPAWMVLDVIPVIPPDLRPLVLLETQTFATSDLNDLYRRIINRNNRLKKLVDMNAPEVIVRNEKRMLQQAVDALFDNARCKRATQGANNRPLKSLTDMIKGKQGRFRENLLGKRVDYSARSVIVVGPTMRLYQCGLPKKIALELFQPFIIRCLKERGHADTIKSAKKMLERKDEEVWDILEEVIKNHPVLLNRAPTLHRMGIQAFEPMLVEGNAIKLHPLACKGFNADFDGDQMAVHLPLSLEAQVEAHTLMLSTNNIFSPANGKPIISPSQDIVMGCYYMTLMLPNMKGEGMTFASKEELLLAYAHKKVALQARISVRMEKNRWQKDDDSTTRETTSVPPGKLFETTVGRVLFNEIIPCDGTREMPFYNKMMRSKELQKVISDCHEICGRRETVDLLDRMMRLGFEESTHSGLSFATSDLIIPKEKKEIVDKGEQEVQNLKDYADEGSISELERYNKTIDIWTRVNAEVTDKMMDDLKNDTHENHPEDRPEGYVNPIYLMSDSGARGGREQIRQLSGMRGLMAKPNGDIIETPVKANFSEGLNVLEYFSSTHGARKGLSDTALKTADSGYLTRKLVDVAQNCVVTMHDCGTKKSIIKGAVYKDDKIEVPLSEAILGRVACDNITSPITDEVIVHKNEVITAEIARKIEDTLGENARIRVRSPMTCEAELGVCALCYGMDLSTSKLVEEGLAVGTIAAQSIGEPGTQLTMRTFHQGGTAGHSAKDIELVTKHEGYVKFKRMEVEEVRPNEPGSKKGARGKKAKAEEDSAAGSLVCVACKPDGGIAICKDKDLHWEIEVYNIPEGAVIDVREGDKVQKDDKLCMIDPHNKLILAKLDGRVHFINIVDGDTVQVTTDEASGKVSRTVTEARGERHPHIAVQDKKGKILEDHYLPGKTQIEVNDGDLVRRGEVLARTPHSGAGNQDITSGLPRVTEIFEARKPKDPAVLAEIDGVVDIGEEKHRKVLVTVRNEKTGKEKVHEVPIGKHNLIVHTGDDIQAGQPLTDGQRVPNEILHISGEEAIQNYLIEEVQKVYRGQGVSINDKHIEVIISQMLRRVKVKDPGDTSLLEGDLVDKFIFRRHNQRLEKCVKVTEQGGTDFQVGEIVPKEVFDEKNAEAQAGGAEPAQAVPPAPAVAETQLLGIAKAAVQSESFISAASFQETTKVLSDAAVAYRIDNLVGLKENVILGRLIPAGTGFRKYQDAEWRYRPEAVENQPVPDLGQSVEMPLLSPDPTEEGAPEDLGVDFMPSFDDVQDEINPEEGDA
ncbi:MAG: DNA-directed RNA polymerase subunit beta' [Thermoguttaceae bacterium]|nr:DNA-directed RNA polymerase subunit beta' [Thermoguttaceae bacterium]